ncbi:MAG TPA: DUF1579 family protein [Candidatus Nitrosotenuis sp.]|jgi:hypothetical protein|nr:DUF1579 family protein [Candidatus Nitrosotenuis sp.]
MKTAACALLLLLVLGRAAWAEADPRVLQALGWLVGTWETEEISYSAEGQPQEPTRGKGVFSWILGDHFLFEEYSSPAFRGRGYTQWNPDSRSYRSWWFDDSGAAEVYEATWDGVGPRVLLSRSDQGASRETYTRVSDTEFTYLLELDTGEGFQKVMEIRARKVK